MNYQQSYNYLISLTNLPSQEYLSKAKNKIYLKRMQILLNILGNPEKKIRHCIHITGTSGKGSVAIMLASILQASGQKTGLLTSPHPSVITERWEINGRPMSKKTFAALMEKMKKALDEFINNYDYDPPSFFEIVTAMGLLYFAEEKIDWAVIEVGLGGKNDSTNIIPKKDLAIITNIGTDHAEIIGPTKADIAREKAGIIKPGCQVLTAEEDKKILEIIKKETKKNKTKLITLNTTVIQSASEGSATISSKVVVLKENIDGTDFTYRDDEYHLPVMGRHQIKNSLLAIEAAKILEIKGENIKKGLARAIFPTRLEIVSRQPLIILDGAHNPDKMKTTVETIKSLKQLNHTTTQLFNNSHLVIGFSGDKEWKKMLKQLASLNPNTVAATRFTSNFLRKVAHPHLIAKKIKTILPKIKTKIFLDPSEALAWSQKQAKKDDLILVTGSLFLSGELRNLLMKCHPDPVE